MLPSIANWAAWRSQVSGEGTTITVLLVAVERGLHLTNGGDPGAKVVVRWLELARRIRDSRENRDRHLQGALPEEALTAVGEPAPGEA